MVKQLCFLDVLRLELFSIFINVQEMRFSIEATVFATDVKLFRAVKTEVNCRNLQKDLMLLILSDVSLVVIKAK